MKDFKQFQRFWVLLLCGIFCSGFTLQAQNVNLSFLIDNYNYWPYYLNNPDANANGSISSHELSNFIVHIAEDYLNGSGKTLTIDCYGGSKTIEGYSSSNGKCTYLIDEIRLENLADLTININNDVKLEGDSEHYFPDDPIFFYDSNIVMVSGMEEQSNGIYVPTGGSLPWKPNPFENRCVSCRRIQDVCVGQTGFEPEHSGDVFVCVNEDIPDSKPFYAQVALKAALPSGTTVDNTYCLEADLTPELPNVKYAFHYVATKAEISGANYFNYVLQDALRAMYEDEIHEHNFTKLSDLHNYIKLQLEQDNDYATELTFANGSMAGFFHQKTLLQVDLVLEYYFQMMPDGDLTKTQIDYCVDNFSGYPWGHYNTDALFQCFPELDLLNQELQECYTYMFGIINCNNITIAGNSTFNFTGEENDPNDDRPILDMLADAETFAIDACENNDIIQISNSHNIIIKNLRLKNAGDDGIGVNGHSQGVLIENVLIKDVGRNCISPTSTENLTIRDCQILGARHFNAIGIDIEPNELGDYVKNIQIDACYFKDNSNGHLFGAFYGPQNFQGQSEIRISNCLFDGGAFKAIDFYGHLDGNIIASAGNDQGKIIIENCGFIQTTYPSTFGDVNSNYGYVKLAPRGILLDESDCNSLTHSYKVEMKNLVFYGNSCVDYKQDRLIGLQAEPYGGNVEIDNIYYILERDAALGEVPFRCAAGATVYNINGGYDVQNNSYKQGKIYIVDRGNPTPTTCFDDMFVEDGCVDPNNSNLITPYWINWTSPVLFDNQAMDVAQYYIKDGVVVEPDGCIVTDNNGDGNYEYSNTFNIGIYKDRTYGTDYDGYSVFKTKMSQLAPAVNFVPTEVTEPSEGSFVLSTEPFCNGFVAKLDIYDDYPFALAWSVTDQNGNPVDFEYTEGYNCIFITDLILDGEYNVSVAIDEADQCSVIDSDGNIDEIFGACQYRLETNRPVNPEPSYYTLSYNGTDLQITPNGVGTTTQWYFIEEGSQDPVLVSSGGFTLANPASNYGQGLYYATVTGNNGCIHITNNVEISACNSLLSSINFDIDADNTQNGNYVVPEGTTDINFGLNQSTVTVGTNIEVYGTLIIEGITVEFWERMGIEVFPGGRLIVRDFATLRGLCDEDWNGIRGKSNDVNNIFAYESNRALIEVYNGVTIEQALIGVASSDEVPNVEPFSSPVFCIGASHSTTATEDDYSDENGNPTQPNLFRNNVRDIRVVKPANSNWYSLYYKETFVKNTHFERRNDKYAMEFSDLNTRIHGCEILGNPNSQGENIGNGVRLSGGQLTMKECVLLDLDNGIHILNAHRSVIQQNTFHSLYRGVYTASSDDLSIENNQFLNIESAPPLLVSGKVNFGIHLFETQGTRIHNNAFGGNAAPIFADYTQAGAYMNVGLLTSLHSKNDNIPNIISDNDFQGTNVGYYSQTGDDGVSVTCNRFAVDGQAHSLTAWRVQDGPYDLLNVCGENFNSRSNLFSNQWLDGSPNFSGSVSNINAPKHIWFEAGLIETDGTPTEYIVYNQSQPSSSGHPNSVLQANDVVSCSSLDFSDLSDVMANCSAIQLPPPPVDPCLAIEMELATISSEIAYLESLINGVDCSCLASIFNKIGEVSCCPTYAKVGQANYVLLMPDTCIGPTSLILPSGITDPTSTGGDPTDDPCSSEVCQELNQWKVQLQQLENEFALLNVELMNCECGDNTPESPCRLENFEQYGSSNKHKVQLAYDYLNFGNAARAVEVIDSTYNTASTDEQAALCNDRTRIHILADKAQDQWTWERMPMDVEETVREWAECNDDVYGYWAKSVVAISEDSLYFHPFLPKKLTVKFSLFQRNKKEETSELETTATPSIKLYPNPAREYLNIDYQGTEAAVLELYDLLGKKVKTIQLAPQSNQGISIEDLPQGNYLYQAKDEAGKWQESGKLLVQ